MSGVTIGDGAVIACNSCVVKNIEPYSLVGGNPAKFIKKCLQKFLFNILSIPENIFQWKQHSYYL